MKSRGRWFIRAPGRSWNASGGQVLAMLGLKKVPVGGMLPRVVQGIVVYADPLRGTKPAHGKRHTHRMMGICPQCKKHMSLGRMHQHVCVGGQFGHVDGQPDVADKWAAKDVANPVLAKADDLDRSGKSDVGTSEEELG